MSKMPTMKIAVKTWREEGIAAGASAATMPPFTMQIQLGSSIRR
jgi:hypothetical protein